MFWRPLSIRRRKVSEQSRRSASSRCVKSFVSRSSATRRPTRRRTTLSPPCGRAVTVRKALAGGRTRPVRGGDPAAPAGQGDPTARLEQTLEEQNELLRQLTQQQKQGAPHRPAPPRVDHLRARPRPPPPPRAHAPGPGAPIASQPRPGAPPPGPPPAQPPPAQPPPSGGGGGGGIDLGKTLGDVGKVAATVAPALLSLFSDRNAKRGVQAVDPHAVLDRLAQMPIATWSYWHDPSVRHMGMMAQDFYGQFGLGDTDRAFHPIDAHGVEMAAIQALNERQLGLDARLRMLEGYGAGADPAAAGPVVAVNPMWLKLGQVLSEVSAGFRATGIPLRSDQETFLRVVEHLAQVVSGLAQTPNDPSLLAEYNELSAFLAAHPDSVALAAFIETHPKIAPTMAVARAAAAPQYPPPTPYYYV